MGCKEKWYNYYEKILPIFTKKSEQCLQGMGGQIVIKSAHGHLDGKSHKDEYVVSVDVQLGKNIIAKTEQSAKIQALNLYKATIKEEYERLFGTICE